jgi:hypothetical protein
MNAPIGTAPEQAQQQAPSNMKDALGIEDPYNVKLSQTYETHQGPVNVMRLQQPTGQAFIDLGKLPFDISGGGMDIDFTLAAKWLERMSGWDSIILGKMHHMDFMKSVLAMIAVLSDESPPAGN